MRDFDNMYLSNQNILIEQSSEYVQTGQSEASTGSKCTIRGQYICTMHCAGQTGDRWNARSGHGYSELDQARTYIL